MTEKSLLIVNAEHLENRCGDLAAARGYVPDFCKVGDPVGYISDEAEQHDAILACPGAITAEPSAKILIINGPNLNLLGTREPDIYGRETLDEIAKRCSDRADEAGFDLTFRQSNHEGEIVEWIQQAIGEIDVIVINAAAYTHTSIAIHDALKAFSGCKVELHISNPHNREVFRHLSYVSMAVDAIVAGLGTQGYELVIELLAESIDVP